LVTHGLWLPRFVALNPCGGICGWHWKIRVCVNNIYCMQEMKIYIWREVLLFRDEIYQVSRNIFSRCGVCLEACQHFEAILWHKVSWTADEIMDCKLCNKAAVTTAMLTPEIKYTL
jgi:MinD superfamily P-loop ATPase